MTNLASTLKDLKTLLGKKTEIQNVSFEHSLKMKSRCQ